jgi:ketosteroid isomerase-like protein
VSQENVEVVRGVYDAFARRDGATPFEHYAPGIEWEMKEAGIVGNPTVYRGHEGVHAMFHDLLQAFREFEFRPLEVTPVGDDVLVTVHDHAVGRTSGAVIDRIHYAVWTLHDDMVTRVRIFLDHTEALKAAGLEE